MLCALHSSWENVASSNGFCCHLLKILNTLQVRINEINKSNTLQQIRVAMCQLSAWSPDVKELWPLFGVSDLDQPNI